MSKKIDELSTASDVGAASHPPNSRLQAASGLRQRGLVAMASPLQRGKPHSTSAPVTNSASSAK